MFVNSILLHVVPLNTGYAQYSSWHAPTAQVSTLFAPSRYPSKEWVNENFSLAQIITVTFVGTRNNQ